MPVSASPDPPPVRSVVIHPPSARTETWNVLRVAALIVLTAWIYLAVETSPPDAAAGNAGPSPSGGGDRAARDLMPYQRLFRTLGDADQRFFRELQEGLLEAENGRAATRRWPAPAALAAQGVPPFADAPSAPGRGYRWQLRQDGLTINYLGLPVDARAPQYLLLIQEPDPRAPLDTGAPAAGNDELHHRLPDGAILHVSIWLRPAGTAATGALAATPGAIVSPYDSGWLQILVGSAGNGAS